MENSIKFLFSGDSALVIEFGNEISVDINKKIRKMMDNIKKENIIYPPTVPPIKVIIAIRFIELGIKVSFTAVPTGGLVENAT